MTIVCLFSGTLFVYLETIPFFSFTANPQLVFAPIILLVGLAITAYHLFKPNSSPYLFSFIWMGSMLVTFLMIFKYCWVLLLFLQSIIYILESMTEHDLLKSFMALTRRAQ